MAITEDSPQFLAKHTIILLKLNNNCLLQQFLLNVNKSFYHYHQCHISERQTTARWVKPLHLLSIQSQHKSSTTTHISCILHRVKHYSLMTAVFILLIITFACTLKLRVSNGSLFEQFVSRTEFQTHNCPGCRTSYLATAVSTVSLYASVKLQPSLPQHYCRGCPLSRQIPPLTLTAATKHTIRVTLSTA